MGVRALPRITERADRARAGPPTEPAAVIEHGTLPTSATVVATLETIAEVARRQIRPPSIDGRRGRRRAGRAAALARAPVRWPGARRGHARAGTGQRLARRLRELGARVVEAPVDPNGRRWTGPPLDPALRPRLPDEPERRAATLFARLRAGGRDARALAGARVAAIGPGTARRAARAQASTPTSCPSSSSPRVLVAALGDIAVTRALIARAARRARRAARRAARAAAPRSTWSISTRRSPSSSPTRELDARAASADYVTFTSSSTVRNFLDAGAERARRRSRRTRADRLDRPGDERRRCASTG